MAKPLTEEIIMKQKLLFAAATAALMAAPSISAAQDTGWYLSGNIGYGAHTDSEFTSGVLGDVESEGGLALSLGLGYEFANNWRLELDGTAMSTDMGTLASAGEVDVELQTAAAMLNAIYDFNDFGAWAPYIGAGLGLVQTDVNLYDRGVVAINDKDSSLGWQILAGLGYSITDNLSWDTNYKYLDAGNVQVDGLQSVTPNAISADVEDVGAHTLMTGFRYRFGGATPPPPPPPPPPAPVADVQCWDGAMVFNANQCRPEPVAQPDVACWDGSMVFSQGECPVRETFTCPDGTLVFDLDACPVRTTMLPSELCADQYRQEIIYYEFDRGQSAETRNTINRILDIGQFCNVQNIRVVGHTDSSGNAAYNMALSQRRAKDARDELVRQGVAGEIITSEGKGETELFVQTGDGVKEQLNRRTEVLITLGSIGAQSFTN
jgi:opacity protein-like surface antigen